MWDGKYGATVYMRSQEGGDCVADCGATQQRPDENYGARQWILEGRIIGIVRRLIQSVCLAPSQQTQGGHYLTRQDEKGLDEVALV